MRNCKPFQNVFRIKKGQLCGGIPSDFRVSDCQVLAQLMDQDLFENFSEECQQMQNNIRYIRYSRWNPLDQNEEENAQRSSFFVTYHEYEQFVTENFGLPPKQEDEQGSTGQGIAEEQEYYQDNWFDVIDLSKNRMDIEVSPFHLKKVQPRRKFKHHQLQQQQMYGPIQVSEKLEGEIRSVKKGKASETNNMGKNMHSITANFINYQLGCRQIIEKQDKDKCWAFCQDRPKKKNGNKMEPQKRDARVKDVSIASFQRLFSSCQLRGQCKRMYESKCFIQKILKSQMNMHSKLIAIKNADRMRRLSTDHTMTRWKQ